MNKITLLFFALSLFVVSCNDSPIILPSTKTKKAEKKENPLKQKEHDEKKENNLQEIEIKKENPEAQKREKELQELKEIKQNLLRQEESEKQARQEAEKKYLEKAKAFFQSKQLSSVVELLESGKKEFPLCTEIYLFLGVAYQQLNNSEKALECYNKVLLLSPTHPQRNTLLENIIELKALSLIQEIYLCYQKKEMKVAMQLSKKFIQLFPDSPYGYHLLGNTCFLEAILSTTGNLSQINAQNLQRIDENELKKAEANLRIALNNENELYQIGKLDPEIRATACEALGLIYIAGRDYQKAIPCLKEGLKLYPNSPTLRENLRIAQKESNFSKSKIIWKSWNDLFGDIFIEDSVPDQTIKRTNSQEDIRISHPTKRASIKIWGCVSSKNLPYGSIENATIKMLKPLQLEVKTDKYGYYEFETDLRPPLIGSYFFILEVEKDNELRGIEKFESSRSFRKDLKIIN